MPRLVRRNSHARGKYAHVVAFMPHALRRFVLPLPSPAFHRPCALPSPPIVIPTPVAVVETAPFEVTEKGWGEFEIHIQIFFQDSRDKPLEITHMLKLYPDSDSGPNVTSKPVVSEKYDELVFNDPSEGLRARLTADLVPSNKGWRHSPNAKWFTDFDAETRHEELQHVYQVITAELQNASKRRLQMEEELRLLRGELGSTL